ncbi:hypothetical protein D3C74_369880 [compost metagenome]
MDHNFLGFTAFVLGQGLLKTLGHLFHIFLKGNILQRIAGSFLSGRHQLGPVSCSQRQLAVKGQLTLRLESLHFPLMQQPVEIPGQITVLVRKQFIQTLDGQQGEAVQLLQTFQQDQCSCKGITVRLVRTLMCEAEMGAYCPELIGGQ